MNLKWDGDILVNGEKVNGGLNLSTLKGKTIITLIPQSQKATETVKIKPKQEVKQVDGHILYRITVKPYMTQQATPEFDFMAKWNNNKPMPLRTMVGWIEKETRGMVYMHLKCLAEPTITCLRCGKELTNPISRAYGIGPICLSELGIFIDISETDKITHELSMVSWEGWVIRSAIKEQEELR